MPNYHVILALLPLYCNAFVLCRTSYSSVTQSRAHLPDEVGALLWVAQYKPSMSTFIPLYVNVHEVSDLWCTYLCSSFVRCCFCSSVTWVKSVKACTCAMPSCNIRRNQNTKKAPNLLTWQIFDARLCDVAGRMGGTHHRSLLSRISRGLPSTNVDFTEGSIKSKASFTRRPNRRNRNISEYVASIISSQVPLPYTIGSLLRFNKEVSYWAFSVVGNWAERFRMFAHVDVVEQQATLENPLFDAQVNIGLHPCLGCCSCSVLWKLLLFHFLHHTLGFGSDADESFPNGNRMSGLYFCIILPSSRVFESAHDRLLTFVIGQW